MIKRAIALFVFFLFFGLLPNLKANAQDSGAVCSVDNSEQCAETSEPTVVGNQSDHSDDCDKTIYVYYGEECSHCHDLEIYLDKMLLGHPEIAVKRYEVWHNDENLKQLKQKASERGIEAKNVPVVFVGHQTFIGYASDELTGVEIKKSIYDLYCIEDKVEEKSITIPFINKNINYSSLSLPALTVILGVVDGFNPCAMWALIALVTILLATEDKRKIRLIGSVFIISSWLIYFMFMAFYLNTFQLLTFVVWLRYLIGALALFAGAAYIKDFITYKPGVCKVTNAKQQKGLMDKMKRVASQNSAWLIIVGVVAIAFSINLVEMVCSLGLPVIYTQILSINNLPQWQYYLYLALYNTLYMADDIIVFIIAATTMNYVHLNNKYDRWMKLVGGVLIIAIGLILALKPDLLG